MKLLKFNYDQWISATVSDVNVGDVLMYNGQVFKLKSEPRDIDGVTHLDGGPATDNVIKVAIDDPDKQHIIEAMDCVGSSLMEFDDGTGIITEFDSASPYVYSPRLPLPELETFCKSHIGSYRRFYDDHREAINDGRPVKMTGFWL